MRPTTPTTKNTFIAPSMYDLTKCREGESESPQNKINRVLGGSKIGTYFVQHEKTGTCFKFERTLDKKFSIELYKRDTWESIKDFFYGLLCCLSPSERLGSEGQQNAMMAQPSNLTELNRRGTN
jgi:hypothetical protein